MPLIGEELDISFTLSMHLSTINEHPKQKMGNNDVVESGRDEIQQHNDISVINTN